MTVTVLPEQFTTVNFDAAALRSIAADLAVVVGLPDVDVVIDVDQTTPTGETSIGGPSPVTLHIGSGALEDAKRPRSMDPDDAADVIGVLLLRARDLLDERFAGPGFDAEVSDRHRVAWVSHCCGRLARLGRPVQHQRRLYHFRNAHAFTDVADGCFDALWDADRLTWAEVVALSDAATSAA